MIRISGVSKSYGDKTAVSGVALTAESGALTYLLGPNGAGKSTLLRLIAGLSSPDRGEVTIDGRRLVDHRQPLRTIGFNIASGSVNPALTAEQHLRWQAELGGVDRKAVGWALRQVGLAGVADRPVGKFSLGMLQRLGIASAILGDPQNLVLDEPANGLDVDGVLWLRDYFTYLAKKRGKALLIASHDLPEVAITADRIAVMGQGRLLADEPAADLLARGEGPRPLESVYVALTRHAVEYGPAGKDKR
ncbi:ABC transporter [Gordonia iterans]|uniref:ABC transporter n=1 Tax=Gordonia iterans TaxID=1004901 RepID=A0A2S0KF80_9ACTN|nr:ATP-binding cassette domain-containing protein [Gordonia iterans]AVM00335.1 ABC transporter [Gordonia iterans]